MFQLSKNHTKYIRGTYDVRIFRNGAGQLVPYETDTTILRADKTKISYQNRKYVIVDSEEKEIASFDAREWEEFPDACFVRTNPQALQGSDIHKENR